jgi:hypothetical protein
LSRPAHPERPSSQQRSAKDQAPAAEVVEVEQQDQEAEQEAGQEAAEQEAQEKAVRNSGKNKE